MKKNAVFTCFISIAIVLWIFPSIGYSQEKQEFKDFKELDIEELLNQNTSIAAKTEQKVSEAPGIVTVITAQEIEAMGARDLRDILEIVPGFEFSRVRNGLQLVGVRGTKDSRSTAKVLLLVDGVPYNTLMYGMSLVGGYEINADAIERLEIIRGPGSALYGRNAFNGVVNVITKSARNNGNTGVRLLTIGGNHNTLGAGISYGVRRDDWDLYLNVLKFNTDGHQSGFDNGMGGTSPWDLSRGNLHFNVKANVGKFQFTGLYSDSTLGSSHGPFVTGSEILTSRGSYSLMYQTKLSEKMNISAELIFQHLKEVQDLEIFKPNLPAPYGMVYPNGMYVKPEYSEYKYGIETEFSYRISDNHQLLAGIQLERYGVNNCDIRSSYDLYSNGSPALFYIRNGEKFYYGRDDMPIESRGWIQGSGHDYYNLAFYIQDTCYPVKNVGVTVGGRYDVDSEFGGVFNPRGAIVWEFIKNGNVKLLYGQAYRAPNCQEQFKTTGFAIGNEELKPERIKTLELGLGYRFKNFSSGVNFFYNKLDDVIYVESRSFGEPNTYLNVGENIAQGFEIENKFFLDKTFWFFLNYSYTDSEDKRLLLGNENVENEEITPHIDIAPHKLNLGFNVGFLDYFNVNTNLIYRSRRQRFDAVEDSVGPYTLVNTTLTVKNLIKALTISASVFNVFDEEYYDQEPGLQYQPAQPGRSFVLKVSYEF